MDQIASFELLSICYPETSRFVMHQHPELSVPLATYLSVIFTVDADLSWAYSWNRGDNEYRIWQGGDFKA
jgi:hypothetical protein